MNNNNDTGEPGSEAYDGEAPLISLHIPKCAGQSLAATLVGCMRADYKLISFYPGIGVGLPEDWKAPRTIIHGHFVRWKGQPVEATCPGATQFTSVLREPFDALVSGYTYGLQSGEDWAVNQSLDSYLDWWLESRNSPLLGALPAIAGERTMEEYANRFLLLGVVDELDAYVEALGDLLGIALDPPAKSNASSRAGLDIPDRRGEFRKAMPLDFELYEYVSSLYRLRAPPIRLYKTALSAARTLARENREWAERTETWLESERQSARELSQLLEDRRRKVDSLERELSPLRAFASRFRWLYRLFGISR